MKECHQQANRVLRVLQWIDADRQSSIKSEMETLFDRSWLERPALEHGKLDRVVSKDTSLTCHQLVRNVLLLKYWTLRATADALWVRQGEASVTRSLKFLEK